MKFSKTAYGLLAATCLAQAAVADVFTIGTFTFNEANSVRTAEVVEGPQNLRDYRNDEFTKRANLDIILDPNILKPEKVFKYFDRSRCVGQLLSRGDNQGIARYITFPEKSTAPPTPNVDSSTIEFTWGHSDLRDISSFDGGPDLLNKLKSDRGEELREELLKKASMPGATRGPEGDAIGNNSRSLLSPSRQQYLVGWALENKDGDDLVVYESGTYEPFSLSVRKAGTEFFTQPRYQFANYFDPVHNVNAIAFELSDFGIAKGEMIDAVRIRNVFNTFSRHGSDRVDDASGQGTVVYPGDPGYGSSHQLLTERDGREFKTQQLDADILYIAALHNIVPLDKNKKKGDAAAAKNSGDSSN
ncbi:MAG: hypothetical protein ACI8QF_003470 [Limisphaerales bacterium]|jgi:hypothetical protein